MSNSGMCVGHRVAGALVVIGALNWGLVGLFHFNLVNRILGSIPTLERVVYVVVGLSGLFMLAACKCCMGDSCKMGEKK